MAYDVGIESETVQGCYDEYYRYAEAHNQWLERAPPKDTLAMSNKIARCIALEAVELHIEINEFDLREVVRLWKVRPNKRR